MSRRGMRDRRGGISAGFINPTMVPGLILWLRSDLGITLNAGAVSAWADQSGLGNNVVQATGSKQPTYNASDSNYGGVPSLRFTRANSQELVSSAFTLTAQPLTIIAVFHTIAQAASQGIVFAGTGPLETFAAAGPNFDIFAANGVATTNLITTTASVIATVFKGAASRVFQNASASPITPSANPGAAGSNQFAIGSTNGANFMDGFVEEVLVYASDPSLGTQWAPLFRYLGARTGIATT